MNVLSLFDGISCGHIALERANKPITTYFASEIKEKAINVTQSNYPNTVQLGDVTALDLNALPSIDLLIGGSPCQDLSIAMKDRQGLNGGKSKLFWTYVQVLRKVKPKFFFLENVARMSKENKDMISKIMGVEPIRINSSKVSAQLRDRLYWTNIPDICQPEDKGVNLQDILTSGYTDREKARALLVSDSRPLVDKARMWHRYSSTGFTTIVFEDEDLNHENIRYFNQTELERLQTVPEGYTRILDRNGAADVLGDGWTVDVIAHCFQNIPVGQALEDAPRYEAPNISEEDLENMQSINTSDSTAPIKETDEELEESNQTDGLPEGFDVIEQLEELLAERKKLQIIDADNDKYLCDTIALAYSIEKLKEISNKRETKNKQERLKGLNEVITKAINQYLEKEAI